jgi:diaminopimelate epimerase
MEFTKMHGLGNDYVYVDCFRHKIENPSQLAVKISDRAIVVLVGWPDFDLPFYDS